MPAIKESLNGSIALIDLRYVSGPFEPSLNLGSTLVRQDKLTLEILALYLSRLDQSWSDGASELRYLLTWRPGYKDKGFPKTPLANAVLAADRVSAGIDGA